MKRNRGLAAVVLTGVLAACGGGSEEKRTDFLYPSVLDPTFGSSGYITAGTGLPATAFLGSIETFDFIVDSAGRNVVVGNRVTGQREAWLHRLLPDGRPDPACNGNGWLAFTTGGPANPASVIELPDGRYLMGGLMGNASIHAVRSDCTLDTAFGTAGRAVFPSPSNVTEVTGGVKAMTLDAAGRVLAAVKANTGRLLVARFLADGSVDTTFGINGTAWHASPDNGTFDPTAVMVRPDGRIVVAGQVSYSLQVGYWAGFVQLNADGTLDTSYGAGGFVSIRPDPNRFAQPLAAVLLADGSAVQTGLTQPAVLGGIFEETDAYLVKVTPGGRADASFGRSGVIVWSAGPSERGSSNYATSLSFTATGTVAVCQNWLNNALVTSSVAVPQVIVQQRGAATGALVGSFGSGGTGWLPRQQSSVQSYCIRTRTTSSGQVVALLDYRAKTATEQVFAVVRVR